MIKIRFTGLVSFFLILIFLSNSGIVFSAQKGGIQYTMPVDYSFFDEKALNNETELLFNRYLMSENEQQKQIFLNQLLSNYSILGNIDSENPLYFTRLGIVYDKLGKDRYAKSNLSRSLNMIENNVYAYYAFGDFYYTRSQYLKALFFYKKAYETGYDKNFDTLYRIAKIYEKLGDFSNAIIYYKKALEVKDTQNIRFEITKLEGLLNNNSLYNKRR